MDGVDPDTLLEWLQTGVGDREIQMMALEQLCMLLLMSDNIDRCFESCPPRTFLPALCKIFLDESAPENVLEVTARAITYYLDVSNECTRRITQVDGAVKAICSRLAVAEMNDRTSKDLAEQCVKLLEHICQRETSAVYDAGGLQCMLSLVRQHGQTVHKDTIHSAMSVVTRLCCKMEPTDSTMPECSASLGDLLENDDPKVSECALRCFAALADRFIRKSLDPVEMARHGSLVDHLLGSLVPPQMSNVSSSASLSATGAHSVVAPGSSASLLSAESSSSGQTATQRPPSFTSVVISLLSNLCRGSAAVTEQVVGSPLLILALKNVLTSKDERCVMDSIRLCDLLILLLCEGRQALPQNSVYTPVPGRSEASNSTGSGGLDRSHRHLIDAIRQRDTDALIEAVESGQVDANFTDDVGQTLLNWSSAFGTVDMVNYLCDKGADVNKGQRSSSLHYAACFGRPDVVKILLRNGANPDLRDEEGKTALDKARERSEEGHQRVATILESPGEYMQKDPEGIESLRDDQTRTCAESTIDPSITRSFLEQMLPVFCDIFQRSLGIGVRRSSLSLMRRTICHMSAESLRSIVASKCSMEDEQLEMGLTPQQKLAENLVSVMVIVLDQEDDVEGHEHVLQVMKSLLSKDADFWLEQFVRVGVFERVEAITNNPTSTSKGVIRITSGNETVPSSNANVVKSAAVSTNMIVADGTATMSEVSFSLARSNSSTPSVSVEVNAVSELVDPASGSPVSITEKDRSMMLNLPTHSEECSDLDPSILFATSDVATPPPTVETPVENTIPSTSCVQSPSQSAGCGDCAKPDPLKSAASSRPSTEESSAISREDKSQDHWAIVEGKCYRWKDWRLIKSRDAFFIWCDAVAMEFSDGSNGWFRFMIDGRLSTMYSSGTPESGSDSAETRGEFVDKLSKARNAVPAGTPLCSVFSKPNSEMNIEVGNWQISSSKSEELIVSNQYGSQQRLIINEDLPGFIFEPTRQTQLSFQAESTMGLDFVTGWAARGGGRRLRFRAEAQKAKLQELAKELWEKYLREARAKPRDALVELRKAVDSLKNCLTVAANGSLGEKVLKEFSSCLNCIHLSIINERLLSTFELSISGLVGALLSLLQIVCSNPDSDVAKSFRQVFANSYSYHALVRKMVLLLETIEKFPQYLYDTPGGSSYGLQLLNRRIKLRLERIPPSSNLKEQLFDRTGRTMKTEPLTTVGQLHDFILQMVAKQWYDWSRETFAFIKAIKQAKISKTNLSFVYSNDFDENGIIYWLGTNGRTVSKWINPASVQIVSVTSSDGARQPYGHPEDILSRDVNPLNCHTSDDKNAHFTIDLGVYIYPSCYTLRHARGYGRSALRNWLLQGSRNSKTWDVLLIHENDTSLSEPGSTATWLIAQEEGKGPYRYLRIAQNGKNASNHTFYLSLSGFEVYGIVVDAVVNDFKPAEDKPTTSVKSKSKKSSVNHRESNVKESLVARPNSSVDEGPSHPVTTSAGGENGAQAIASKFPLAGFIPDASVLPRSRFLRLKRGSRLNAFGGRPRGSLPPVDASAECCIGSRVLRGPDWNWTNQRNGIEGTVVSAVERGWVDVQWDDKTRTPCRYGAEGKFDIEVISKDASISGTKYSVHRKGARGFREIVARRGGRGLNDIEPMLSGLSPLLNRRLPPPPQKAAEQPVSSSVSKKKTGISTNSAAPPFCKFNQSSGPCTSPIASDISGDYPHLQNIPDISFYVRLIILIFVC
ncbi:hypothetical protein AB6A40_006100 [Gnathostoma spinigerum]|uniref:E3 ubiquitin-protein ligase n=1 Tax=Gnathostoma spinigerum TaxID=75299 RepID=A0ABD6EPN4_9BILA